VEIMAEQISQQHKESSPEMLSRARVLHEQIVAWRRTIHRHPELGFQERRTARLVADALQEMGLQVETGVGKAGVVGHLGQGRPAVGLRADMDALEIQEANDLPYASCTPGLMHACGHDAHTAMLLGAAELLQSLPSRPGGEIRFLFQPCEEAWDSEDKGGALRMAEDGALEGLDAVIGLHVDPRAEAGSVGVRSGYVMPGVDPYDAILFGRSCHSSRPHQGLNPILILSQVLNAILAIRAERIDPLMSAVVSVEAVHGGSTTGVIPDRVTLSGNIRAYDDVTRLQLRKELDRALSLARTLGGDYELDVRSIFPACYNDPHISSIVQQVAMEMIGARNLYEPDLNMAGEDFSYMTQAVPGAFVQLGVKIEGEQRALHSATFDVDESALPVGSAILAETTCCLLRDLRK
jgi:amidohydrolase